MLINQPNINYYHLFIMALKLKFSIIIIIVTCKSYTQVILIVNAKIFNNQYSITLSLTIRFKLFK